MFRVIELPCCGVATRPEGEARESSGKRLVEMRMLQEACESYLIWRHIFIEKKGYTKKERGHDFNTRKTWHDAYDTQRQTTGDH